VQRAPARNLSISEASLGREPLASQWNVARLPGLLRLSRPSVGETAASFIASLSVSRSRKCNPE